MAGCANRTTGSKGADEGQEFVFATLPAIALGTFWNSSVLGARQRRAPPKKEKKEVGMGPGGTSQAGEGKRFSKGRGRGQK